MAGKHVMVAQPALDVLAERFTTDKHTLQRYRHVIVDVTNARFARPGSAQSKVNRLLKGVVGLSFDEQRDNFEEVVELTYDAPSGNIKAQSARLIAERALHVIETRESESSRTAAVAPEPVEGAWDEDEDDDSEF